MLNRPVRAFVVGLALLLVGPSPARGDPDARHVGPPSMGATVQAAASFATWQAAARYAAAVEAARAVPRSAPQRARRAPVVVRSAPQAGACSGWLTAVAALWPPGQVPEACKVLGCESGGNVRAHNRSGASGLMQLMPGHAGLFAARGWSYAVDVWNGVRNLVVAHDLWLESGWGPWSCR